MGSININDGTWKSIQNFHVNTGSWNQAKRVWVHTGGGWVLAWENELNDTFTFAAGQTYQGSVLCGTERCTKQLVVGESPNNDLDHNGLWVLNNGSASGTQMGAALNGRTLIDFRITLGLSWSYSGRYNGDGIPTRAALWGHTYSSIPGSYSSGTGTFLCEIAWYPSSSDYSAGRVPITQAMLGNNPPTQGNRYPQVIEVDILPYLSAGAKTALTNGTINSFALRQYNYLNQKQNYTYYSAYSEPGQTYTTSGIAATGDANAFRIRTRHTG